MHASRPRGGLERFAILVLAFVALEAHAQATPSGELTASLVHNRVVTAAGGAEKLEAAPRVAPGDVIEYRAAYANRGKASVNGVEASMPVPAGMEYVPGTARPANPLASTGDGRFAPIPLKRRVQSADGKTAEEDVPASEYRVLRWKVGEIAAGGQSVVSARMRVAPVPAPQPQAAQAVTR